MERTPELPTNVTSAAVDCLKAVRLAPWREGDHAGGTNHRSQRRGDPTAISYGGIAVITTTGVMGARGAPYPSAVLIGAYTQCYCALGFSSWTLLIRRLN